MQWRLFYPLAGVLTFTFILVIIWLYMLYPLIKLIIQSETGMKYCLALSFAFAFCIPEVVELVNDFGSMSVKKGVNALYSNLDKMNLHLALGYVGYFILGYYLRRISIAKRKRIVVYILGFIGLAFTIGMDSFLAIRFQHPCDNYYSIFAINVLLQSVAVFIWFKYRESNDKSDAVFRRFSKYSFGVYLVHVLIIEQLDIRFGLNTLTFNPILSVLCISVMVFIFSFVVSALLNNIPVLKKYIV